ncbi:hypothetical protein TNCV_1689241 [Trichonephila clavipes]|nr:hypothetical protein TNCV_1689241 [Trichonephila clavipes]
MSTLDLRPGYFLLAANPKDIIKTAFVAKNGTILFTRMPFGLSGAAPNFQKAIDMILKPVWGVSKNNKQMFLNMVYAFPSLQWLLRTVSAYSESAGATFLAVGVPILQSASV